MVQRVEQREKAQTALALMFAGPSRADDARFATAMIAGVASGLGGRFFDELRDKQSLGYTVHAFATERALAGVFVSYIATSPDKEDVARRGLLDEFAKLRDEPVTAKELDQAKTYALGVHAIRQQSGAAVLGEIVDAYLFGRLARAGGVRDAGARRVRRGDEAIARTYFDEERRVEGIVEGQETTTPVVGSEYLVAGVADWPPETGARIGDADGRTWYRLIKESDPLIPVETRPYFWERVCQSRYRVPATRYGCCP